MNRFLMWLVRVITSTFFRRIDVVAAEKVPGEGPVIFAGNHPNALMDGWLLTAKCGRTPLHFMVNAKLWEFPILGRLLTASGAVPVYRREEHGDSADNSGAFEKTYEVLENGHCMGIFPEGVSHAESQLTKLKTGTARIALEVAARGKAVVTIVPCGLNYMHRHRFRSQVLIEFGEPIVIDEAWIEQYRADEQAAVQQLTEHLAMAIAGVTLNAPDWNTLRFAQTARRLYKPSNTTLTPAQYVELNRRFIQAYLERPDDDENEAFRRGAEEYQARLDMLGLKDHQLRQPVSLARVFRKITLRSLWMLILLPLSVPGTLLHLPIGWTAAIVGERFSYEMDDVATLKVFATIMLLPLLYLIIGIAIGVYFGPWWAVGVVAGLLLSFYSSVLLIEAQTSLFVSILSLLRLARLRSEVDALRVQRAELVETIRELTDRRAPDDLERMFTREDFGTTGE